MIPMHGLLLATLVTLVVGIFAGYGWGKAGVAETVARLVAELEIARQAGTLRENGTAAAGRAATTTIKRLLSVGPPPERPQAALEHAEREKAVDRGAEMLIADARRNGQVLSLADAREAARQMMSEVGFGS